MNENKPFINTVWIDVDDAPELTDAFFEQADEYSDGVLVKRGQLPQTPVNLPLDNDVITAFKSTEDDWQARINDVLREWANHHALTTINNNKQQRGNKHGKP